MILLEWLDGPQGFGLKLLVGEMLFVAEWVCKKWLLNVLVSCVGAFSVVLVVDLLASKCCGWFFFLARVWLITCWYMGSFGVR